jgi:hypothetical protein
MKKTKATHLLLLIAAGVFGCSTAAHAQNADADIQYWDGGTSGTWDAGLTADWTNPQANPPYVTTPPGQSPGTTVYYNSNDRNLDSRPQVARETGRSRAARSTAWIPTIPPQSYTTAAPEM